MAVSLTARTAKLSLRLCKVAAIGDLTGLGMPTTHQSAGKRSLVLRHCPTSPIVAVEMIHSQAKTLLRLAQQLLLPYHQAPFSQVGSVEGRRTRVPRDALVTQFVLSSMRIRTIASRKFILAHTVYAIKY